LPDMPPHQLSYHFNWALARFLRYQQIIL
jgi:hypothetical protein